MREMSVTEAKARFSTLLDRVEKGETVIITRHGRTAARLVSEKEIRQKEIDEALTSIKEFHKHTKK
jgi:prevent-host-death family protein